MTLRRRTQSRRSHSKQTRLRPLRSKRGRSKANANATAKQPVFAGGVRDDELHTLLPTSYFIQRALEVEARVPFCARDRYRPDVRTLRGGAFENTLMVKLAEWQGLNFATLFRIFWHAPDTAVAGVLFPFSNPDTGGPGITLADFLDARTFDTIPTIEGFYRTILFCLIAAASDVSVPPFVHHHRLVMYSGVARIVGYLFNAPYTSNYTNDLSLSLRYQLITGLLDTSPDPYGYALDAHTIFEGQRITPRRPISDYRTAAARPINKKRSLPGIIVPARIFSDRRIAYEDYVRASSSKVLIEPSTPRTVVLLNSCHSSLAVETSRLTTTQIQTWKIPEGKSLILVSMSTVGCSSAVSDTEVVYLTNVILKHVRNANTSNTFIDPVYIADFCGAMLDQDQGPEWYQSQVDAFKNTLTTKHADFIRAEKYIYHIEEFKQTRTTYYTPGDYCVQKTYSRNENNDELVTRFGCDEASTYDISPPFIPIPGSKPVAYFTMADIVLNMYRQGHDNVVLVDLSCSGFEGDFGRRNVRARLRSSLEAVGLAGGDGGGGARVAHTS